MLKGIDVSVWQGSIDWSKTKDVIDFALLRAGYGKLSSQKDARFEEYYAACEKYGIPKGAYWFSYATTREEAVQEAKACAACLKGKKFEYPILFDMEHSSQQNKAITSAIIPGFCETLKSLGYYVGIYTYYSFITNFVNSSVYAGYDLAMAQYSSTLSWKGDKAFWQYSEKGSISGITGTVDLDYCYVNNYPEKIKSLGLNGYASSSTKTTTTATTESTSTTYLVDINKTSPENKVLTYGASDKTQISKHFNVQEFKCKCGKSHSILVNPYLVYKLEKIMDTMDCSKAIINSGYRCPDYDKQIGGFVGQHGIGNAVDVVFYDKNVEVISTKKISCLAQDLGLEGIANINKTYTAIHLDARTGKTWKGNEVIGNNSVTTDFYTYYGLSKSDVYGENTTAAKTSSNKKETATSSNGTVKAGTKLTLKSVPLYASATIEKVSGKKSGTYYIYDDTVQNGRVRITTSASNVKKTPVSKYVSGWINVSDVN